MKVAVVNTGPGGVAWRATCLLSAPASMTARPVRADSRAASRISVTTTLLASDERPFGLTVPRTTAVR